ncbi:MAG TPA: ABC transporter permease subunit [Anaerolineales bacterium]|nr:ABC transporter permease subunit [Anaerolineales bacterium]
MKNNPSTKALPAWWLVFTRELSDLWVGGKALILILIYTIVLAVMVYVYSFNTELSLIPPKESVYEMLKNAMAVSMFVGLVIGADTLSGERERNTFESLLLTPVSRRQIILGKFLAAISIWPVAYAIAIPFMNVLSQGDEILVPAILWGLGTGTISVFAFTALGMLVSFWSSSNKVSYFASLGVYVLLLVPAELPGTSSGAAGQFLQWINPMASVNHFLSKHLVNYEPFSLFWSWLIAPTVLAIVSLGLLFFYAGPGLRLEPGKTSWPWAKKLMRTMGLGGMAVLILMLSLSTSPVRAQGQTSDLQISIDLDATVVKTGDTVEYNTVVTNNSAVASPPLIVAMNVVNLDAKGDTVDPEDWAPKRTQYIESLAAGESVSLHWIINTILEGNYMVYMVLIPEPADSASTSQAVATSGIHLTVNPFTRLNPGGVLPYAIGAPLLVIVIMYFVNRRRNQHIDAGAS